MTTSPGRFTIYTVAITLSAVACIGSTIAQAQGSVEFATELMSRAEKLVNEGKYSEAIQASEEALSIRQKALGPNHPDTAATLNRLGLATRSAGDLTRAESLFRQAIEIREKVLGESHSDTASSVNNLAVVFFLRGDLAQAETLYRRALQARENSLGPEHPDTAGSINNLALLYSDRGLYSRAEPLFQRALTIREKALGPESPDTAASMSNLALLYYYMANYSKSEQLLRRSLAIREKVLGPEHPHTARDVNNLAQVNYSTGAYAEAERLYLRALEIYEKTLGPNHMEVSQSLNNLALVYISIGDLSRAEALYLRSIAITDKSTGPDSLKSAMQLTNLADLYVLKGSYGKASPLAERALAIKEQKLGAEHPFVANALETLSKIRWNHGDPIQAEQLLLRSLAIREQISGLKHPATAATLEAIATLKWAQGDVAKAGHYFRRAQEIVAKNIEQQMLFGSESRRHAYLQDLANSTNKQITLAVSTGNLDCVALSLTSVLLQKGRVLDSVSDGVSRLRLSANPEDRVLLDRLSEVASELSNMTYQSSTSLSVAEYRRRIQDLNGKQEQLESELSKRSAVYRRQIVPITINSVSQSLPSDAALLEIARYSHIPPQPERSNVPVLPRYVAFVLKRNTKPVAIDLGDAESIESLVREFRLWVSDSGNPQLATTSKSLSDRIIKPILPHLEGIQHLLVSPDGEFNLLPIGAMTDSAGNYLLQRFDVSYVTSGRDLLHLEVQARALSDPLIIANPDFGNTPLPRQTNGVSPTQRSAELDRSGLIFRQLTGTELEAKELQRLLKMDPRRVLVSGQATESNLRAIHSPSILHVASHGFFLGDMEPRPSVESYGLSVSRENPLLRSGIALAGANLRQSGEGDDGILTALEVARLDLLGTKLVVLSTCDSGIGQVRNGEGVYGLRRAIVLAGAETQITSLWRVSDETTRMLMVDYYTRLINGEGRSTALRHAQQRMLKTPEYAHPYYWASFIPVGNWAPLPTVVH